MAEFDDLIPSDTVVTDDPFADLIPQPVIRLAPPGSLRPDDLVPAIRKIGGEIVLGQRDETHPDIIDRTGLKATEIDQRGFAGPKGEFYDRESAAQATQLPTAFEPGRLHSTDLIEAPKFESPMAITERGPVYASDEAARQYGALKPSDLSFWQEFRRGETGRAILGPTPEERELGVMPRQQPGLVPLALSVPTPFAPPAGSLASKALLSGFVGQFIIQAPAAWKSFKAAADRGDWSEAGKIAVETGFGAAFTALAGKGLLEELRSPPARVVPLELVPSVQRKTIEKPAEIPAPARAGTAQPETGIQFEEHLSPTDIMAVRSASTVKFSEATRVSKIINELGEEVYSISYGDGYIGYSKNPIWEKHPKYIGESKAYAKEFAAKRAAASKPTAEKGPENAVKTREEQKGGVGEHPQAAEGRIQTVPGGGDRPGEPAPLPEERPAKSQVLLKPHIAAAKLTPEGDVIYARDHRAAEIEMASGQDGFLVLPEGSDSMLLEYDSLTLSPKHMQELNAEFVSLQEAQAAKGDIVAAARLKSEARKRQERPAQGEVLLKVEPAAAAAPAEPKVAAPEPAAAKEPSEMTKDDLVMELIGKKPELRGTANVSQRVQWEKDRKRYAKLTKTELADRVAGTRENLRYEQQLHSSIQSILPGIQEAASNAGLAWRSRLRGLADEAGVAYNPPAGVSRGDAVYTLSRTIAQKRLREASATEPKLAVTESAAAKEPWQMTREEFASASYERRRGAMESKWTPEIARYAKRKRIVAEDWITHAPDDALTGTPALKRDALAALQSVGLIVEPGAGAMRYPVIRNERRWVVENAIKEGRAVPGEVLADYPDLAKKAQPPPPDLPEGPGATKEPWQMTAEEASTVRGLTWDKWQDAIRKAQKDGRLSEEAPSSKSADVTGYQDWNKLKSQAQRLGQEKPLREGPGAASVTDFPKEAQIEQLAREVGRVKGEKAPLLNRVKEAFNIGRQRQAAGDLVTRTLSGLKTAGDYLIQTWRGPTKLDDILRVKGELSAELETRSWRLRQAMRDLKQAVPQRAVREAIAKWVDAGGDEAKLRAALDTVPANRKAAYQRALNLTPDEKLVAGHIQSYFEARLQEAIDAGVLEEGIDDYIHRIYPKDTPWRRGIVNAIQNGLLDTRKPGLARQRVFELDADAERAGYQPISDFLPRLIEYEASLSKAIASRAAVKRFSEVKMADGRPMLDVAGMGTPIEDPATGVREATLIKPKFKPGQDQFDADGNPTLNYRKDYVARDYPALRKWRWATADADGKPIFVQGDVLIHPDAVKRMDVLLQPSKLREYGAIRAALAIGSAFKQTMLDLSGFHQVQITVHGGEHKVSPLRLVQDIDFTNPEIQRLLRGGMTLGGDARSGMYQEGLVGRSLTRLVPGLGDLMQSYHEWLFQSYIPRMKTTMALHALERNKARFAKDLASGRITTDVLYHQTAKEANAAFGELNYIMLERSKTAQDLSRLILLAPDFLEARARFALQAGTRLGGEQRMALLLGALTMYITARLANKALSGEYHTEPENLFSIVYNGKAYSLRTVQGDILHALEEPLRFWLHRLNPTLTRPLLQLITQRDEFGRKRTFWQIMGDSISNIVPISLRRSREQQWHTSLLNAFGGSVRRDSDVRRVYDAAAQYKKAHGIRGEPGEFIYDPASDVYRPLKLAILDGNHEAAASEYRKLIDSKTLTARQAEQHFLRYARSPFTGSQKNEKKFFRSLSKEMQLQYEGAKQEKLRVLKGFRQARSMAASLKPTGAFDDLIPAGQ